MQERPFNTKVLAILVLALFVRLLGVISRPVWYDEAFAILFSAKGLSAMLYGTLAPTGIGSADIHPLGYYTILWIWMKMFGESLVAARSLSILAGMVSVYLIYLIALEATSDTSTAYFSMLLAAFAPFQIHYAQEIRMYAFLSMWLLMATYAYQRGSQTGNWKWWALFSISAALAQYTHNLAAFYLIGLSIWPILQQAWRTTRDVVLAGIGALILYSPWALQLPAQFAKVQNAYWVVRPDISNLFTLLLVFVTNTPLPVYLIIWALSIVLIIVTIGLIQTIRYTSQKSTRQGLWLFYMSFAPPVFLFLFSQWRPVYIERALIGSGGVFCIWLAWVITKTNLPSIAQYTLVIMLGVAFTLGIYQQVTYRDFPYAPFKELSVSLQQRVKSQDAIVHSNKLSMLPVMLFDHDLTQSFIGDPPGSSVDTLAAATQEILGIHAEKDIRSATKEAKRVWYIIYDRSIEEYQAAGYETHPDVEYLNSQFHLQIEEHWDELQLFLYTKEP